MANKAGYQRNDGKLHHAQPLAVGAEEKHLTQSAIARRINIKMAYLWLKQSALEKDEGLPFELVNEFTQRRAYHH
jgi:hypothetical protein